MSDPTDRRAALTRDILILSNYYHPEPTGSAPPITDLSVWLAEQGLEPSVLTARPSYPRAAVYEGYASGELDIETWHGVSVRRVASIVPRTRGLVGRLIAETSFAAAALLTRRRGFAGVVCVCPSVFAVLAAPAFRKRGGRLVAIVHDIQSGLASSLQFGGAAKALMKGLQHLEAWALNRCDTVICLSEAMGGELRAIGVTAPIKVIPPQVNIREIMPTAPEEAKAGLVLYSGNLGRKQGLDQVLGLAAELLRRRSGAKILIRGEGSERAALEQQASAEGLSNVAFADLAPRQDISAALGEAALHLVPQAPGGANFALPSKIFSIMAAQRPFVATAAPSTPLDDLCRRSGGGLCVEPMDAGVLADAVESLLADPARGRNLGEAGRRYVETEVDREIVCKNILETLYAVSSLDSAATA